MEARSREESNLNNMILSAKSNNGENTIVALSTVRISDAMKMVVYAGFGTNNDYTRASQEQDCYLEPPRCNPGITL